MLLAHLFIVLFPLLLLSWSVCGSVLYNIERDQAVADFNRRNAQLAQMEETQRTLHEHLYILKTKYDTVKVRTPRPATSARGLS